MTGWLEKFGPAILAGLFGALSALVSAMLVPWFQDRRRARREHLDQIKAQVFRRLQEDLERLYLPLLRGKIGPVVSKHILIPVEGPVSESPTTWDWRLAPRRTYEEPSLPGFQTPQPPSPISPELYDDAKRYHYQKVLGRLEAFKVEFEAHTAEWTAYAGRLAQAIAERAGLPLVQWPSASSDPSWVDANGLAVYVVERQLGVARHPPFPGSDGRSLMISNSAVVKAETQEALQRIWALLDELSRERRTVEDLRRRAEPLEQQAASLLHQLNHLLFSSRLLGRCPLAKV